MVAAARARAEVIAALVQYLRWRRVMKGRVYEWFQQKEPPGARRNEKPEARRVSSDIVPRDGHYILWHKVLPLFLSALHRLLLLHVSGLIATLTT